LSAARRPKAPQTTRAQHGPALGRRAAETVTAASVLTIDLGAIAANYRTLKSRLDPSCECAAVVKADAYGLGAAQVAPALVHAGCRSFFVFTIDEGIALRQALQPVAPEAAVYVMQGPLPGTEALFDRHRLVPFLNTVEQVASWAAHGGPRPAALMVDTGMSRLGLSAHDIDALQAEPGWRDGVALALVVSHLACADDPADAMNASQLALFRTARTKLPAAPASLANSPGIFLGPDYHFDLVRPGAALYGLESGPASCGLLRQVVELKARILQVRDVDRGTAVGYGAAHRVARRSRIATAAIGYGDGLNRQIGDRGSGFIDGTRVPLVGRVSMDVVTFDVTDVPEALAAPGAQIELMGPHHSVDALAEEAGTIGYEILTSLGRRFRRAYVGVDG
jgi:alanine racemase